MIQIIGTKTCRETQKAIRFCKERSIEFQFVDLHKRNLSDGEWNHIFCSCKAEDLIDDQSQYYRKEGYAWRDFSATEELKEHPQLVKTPIIRKKGICGIGANLSLLEEMGRSS